MKTIHPLMAVILLGATTLAHAAAESPFHDKPASPRSLPADNLPPFGMLDDKGKFVPAPELPAGGIHKGAGSPPESTAPAPSLDLANALARAALDACSVSGFRVGVAVVDSVGEARAMLTADGSDGSHVFVAMRKAISAVAFEMPSSEANALVMRDPKQVSRVTPAMFVEGGAVPLRVGGKLIGALGVSGAAGDVIGQADEACAQAAVKKLAAKLK